MTSLLEARSLRKSFRVGSKGLFGKHWMAHAVDNVSFGVAKGETFGLVGESGCGKTTTARLVLRLVEPSSGEVMFDGRDVLACSPGEMRRMRREMQLVFQDSLTALNPRMSIGASIADTLRFHGIGNVRTRIEMAREMLETVGLSANYFSGLPHEFSGGQCQRVGIARALILKPKLVVLDEPVSALDVSIRAQILNLLRSLQDEFGLTYVFISHDLIVVRKFCDKMAVLYLGKMVEIGPSEAVSKEPLHPYTKALIDSIPIPEPNAKRVQQLTGIEGELPSLLTASVGCPFASRCPQRMERCSQAEPELVDMGGGRRVACFLHSDAVVQEHRA